MNKIAISAIALAFLATGTAFGADQEFLQRYAVPGNPEDTSMHTDLALATNAAGTNAGEDLPASSYKVELVVTQDDKEVIRGTVVGRAGQPVPFSVLRQIDYIKSVTGTDSTQTAESATLNTGLSASFVVTPAKNDMIAVQYAINQATLNAMNNVKVGGVTVQVPDVTSRSAQQQVLLRNGGSFEGMFSDGTKVSYTVTVSKI